MVLLSSIFRARPASFGGVTIARYSIVSIPSPNDRRFSTVLIPGASVLSYVGPKRFATLARTDIEIKLALIGQLKDSPLQKDLVGLLADYDNQLGQLKGERKLLGDKLAEAKDELAEANSQAKKQAHLLGDLERNLATRRLQMLKMLGHYGPRGLVEDFLEVTGMRTVDWKAMWERAGNSISNSDFRVCLEKCGIPIERLPTLGHELVRKLHKRMHGPYDGMSKLVGEDCLEVSSHDLTEEMQTLFRCVASQYKMGVKFVKDNEDNGESG